MSKEIKDIPAEELERIEQDANKKYLVKSDLPEYLFREAIGLRKGYADGAKAEYLRHLSGKAVIETEIRRSTIDRLYQSILASGQPFPGELRDIFHKAMNALGASPSSKPEIRLREGEKVVLDRDFNNASVVTLIRCSTHYSTVSDGKSTWDVMTDRLCAIPDKSIPSSEPAKEPQPEDEVEKLRGLLLEMETTRLLKKWALTKSNKIIPNSLLEVQFNELASKWKDETGLFSTTFNKIVNDHYFEIVAMGKEVVPFILRDLQNNGPSHWHTALKALTKENPVSEEDMKKNKKIREAWIAWGKANKMM